MKAPGRVLVMKGKYCRPHPQKKFEYLRRHRPDLAQLALATLDKIYREARYPPPPVTPPCGDVYVLHPAEKPKYSRAGT